MQRQDANPVLSNNLRWFLMIVELVVIFGSGLLVLPDLIRPRWPWSIAPFNAAFLGTIYITELIVDLIPILINKWSPVRLILPIAFTFVTVVSGVTLFYLDNFNPQKVATYAWYIAYFGSVIVLGYFIFTYRRLWFKPDTFTIPPPWKFYLWLQGCVLFLYGAGLLVFPAIFSGWWPWKIDTFHSQIYSGVFISGGVGSYFLSRFGARVEFLALGIVQISLGLFSIFGLLIVDSSQHRVNWSATGTWLWLISFVLLSSAGLVMLFQARWGRYLLK